MCSIFLGTMCQNTHSRYCQEYTVWIFQALRSFGIVVGDEYQNWISSILIGLYYILKTPILF
jgi:hypothetical protein